VVQLRERYGWDDRQAERINVRGLRRLSDQHMCRERNRVRVTEAVIGMEQAGALRGTVVVVRHAGRGASPIEGISRTGIRQAEVNADPGQQEERRATNPAVSGKRSHVGRIITGIRGWGLGVGNTRD